MNLNVDFSKIVPNKYFIALLLKNQSEEVLYVLPKNYYLPPSIGTYSFTPSSIPVINFSTFKNYSPKKCILDVSVKSEQNEIFIKLPSGEYCKLNISTFEIKDYAIELDDSISKCSEDLPSKFSTIPTISKTTNELIKLLNDDDHVGDIEYLYNLIKFDQPLSSQLISISNSPNYSNINKEKITDLKKSLTRIGYIPSINLSLCFSLYKNLKLEKISSHRLQLHINESLTYADKALSISQYYPSIEKSICFLIGLLLNFGDLLIAQFYPEKFSVIDPIKKINSHINPEPIEMKVIGLTSSEIAGWLLYNWGMPMEVTMPIRYQWCKNIDMAELELIRDIKEY